VTYIIEGQIEHSDSRGNHASLEAGCMQWLNAGSGIVCDQDIKPAFKQGETEISVIRAWINLPTIQKLRPPEYLSFCHDEIPHVTLNENAGWVRILCGSYDHVQARIPSYSKQFLYHIHIEPARTFSMMTEKDQEYVAFLPTHDAVINELQCQRSECILFGSSGDFIEIQSDGDLSTDVILFGGAALNEPFIREEGFVMNSPHEITQAYNDYYDGRYGHITYNENNKTD
ncbi:MAG TPA: pirin-like C-terminal cupin domain-containing protein, partial [Puia sp.]|nr:pirin-like C-terminal cupin domain-containing protein [Puia sp.]